MVAVNSGILGPHEGIANMGIHNRDYMKRPSDDDGGSASPDDQVEDFLNNFLKRHPRFFLYVGIGFAALILIALLVYKLSS